MKHDQTPFAPEAATDEPASPSNPAAQDDGPAFGSEAEQAALIAERDAFFGFEGGRFEEADFFCLREAETYETSADEADG